MELGGTLVLAGAKTLTVSSGTIDLTSSGTIRNAIIANTRGVIQYSGGTLDGVTYRGTLDLSASGANVTIMNGLTLTGASGTGAGAIDFGSASIMYVVGKITLNTATITMSGGEIYNCDISGTGQVLTLGSGLMLRDTAGGLTLYAGGAAGDGIVNQGKIIASTNAGSFSINGVSFTNQGSIAVSNGDTLSITTTSFSNTRGYSTTNTITDNGRLVLNGGSFVSAGTLPIGTTGTLSGYGSIARPIANAGLLDAVGGTLALTGAVTGTGALRADTGAVLQLNEAAVTALAGRITLNGVGSVIAFGTGPYKTLEASLASIAAIGTLAALGGRGFTSGNTLPDSGVFTLVGGTASIASLVVASGGRLLGSGTVANVVADSGTIESSGGVLKLAGGAAGTGTLLVDAASTLKLAGATNAGTLTDGGVLKLDGQTTTIASTTIATAGRIAGSGTLAGTIANSGAIESSGGLLKLAAGATGTGTLLVDAASTLELAATTTAGTVTDNGTLKLDGQTYTFTTSTVTAGAKIFGSGTIANTVANAGTIESNGGLLKLAAGGSGAGSLTVDAGSTLELAATTTAGTVTDNGILKLDGQTCTFTTTVAAGGKILGFGTIAKAVANAGAIESNGGLLKLAAGATGTGALSVDAGSTLELAAASAGTITVGGVLKLDGFAVTATAATIATTGLVQGFGSLSGNVANGGTIDAKGGLLKLSSAVSGAGALQIEAGATLELAAAAQAVIYAAGGVATLRLDAQASFTGAIKGLALGDAINFSSETVTSAVVSGTTLTVVGSAGTAKYQVAGALSGNHFAVQSDGHTITLTTGTLTTGAARAQFLAPSSAPSNGSPAPSDAPVAWLAEEWTAPRLLAAAGFVTQPVMSGALTTWPAHAWPEPVFAHH